MHMRQSAVAMVLISIESALSKDHDFCARVACLFEPDIKFPFQVCLPPATTRMKDASGNPAKQRFLGC
jgi:hypothetical protein